jgi:hypothetical protein
MRDLSKEMKMAMHTIEYYITLSRGTVEGSYKR